MRRVGVCNGGGGGGNLVFIMAKYATIVAQRP